MQKVIFVKDGLLDEVNRHLASGWKVVKIEAVSSHTDTYYSFAYFVLEK